MGQKACNDCDPMTTVLFVSGQLKMSSAETDNTESKKTSKSIVKFQKLKTRTNRKIKGT